MHTPTRKFIGVASCCALSAATALAVGSLVPAAAVAQTAQSGAEPGAWRYAGSLYLYLPSVGGSTSYPTPGNGTPINVSADQILERLQFTAMGSFDAHNGTWGVFTDLVYLNFGDTRSNSRDFTIGNIGLPANTTANLDWDLKGWVWTLAGEYRLPSPDPAMTVDLLAGTRMFDLRTQLSWNISGSIGPIDPAARSGTVKVGDTVWDAIIGVKGRYVFGGNRQWAVPFYFDVGTGQSDYTVQGATGISYAFQWGELNALWRYLGYKAKSDKAISEVNFSGPQVGVVFRW
ncbi:MAG: hypothetical protein ACHP83_10310 [Burkholderiales bacterium]